MDKPTYEIALPLFLLLGNRIRNDRMLAVMEAAEEAAATMTKAQRKCLLRNLKTMHACCDFDSE